MNIPFSPPFINHQVINEVVDSLNSGWITTGPKVKALEEEIKKITGCPEALCVNSWTSGAMLVLKWFGVTVGDEVIIPAYTYAATALSVIHCGATPVMVDVLDDFTMDPVKLKQAINNKTKAIMPVDFGGVMCNYEAINSIARDPETIAIFEPNSDKQKLLGRIIVISDAAHSIGAYYKNIPSGMATDITVFSFHAVKNITTSEGGAICLNLPHLFNNEEEYKLMRCWALNGQTKDAFTKSQAGGWRYDILFAGLKINMPDLCAALGLAQIRQYEMILKERERIAIRYDAFFRQKIWANCPILKDSDRLSCYHIYPLRFKGISESQRDRIIEDITSTGIGVNVHFMPLPMLTLFKDLGFKIDDYPVAYDNYSREISLPIHPQLTNEQIDYICEAVLTAYKKVVLND